MRRDTIFALRFAIVAGGILCFFQRSALSSESLFSFSKPKVRLGTVHRADLLQQVTVAGTVVPYRRTLFNPAFNGYVRKIFVDVGQQVPAGAPIVSLTVTPRENDDGHPLRAPFSGTVVQILKTEGEYVETAKDGMSLVRLDDLSRLFVVSDVPEGDIEKMRLGQEAVLKVSGIPDRTYKGIIREISLAAKEKKDWNRSADRVEFTIRIEVVNRDEKLHPGMSTIVDIVTDKREKVLALAHEFIEKQNDRYIVTLDNGERRDVKVGMQNEEMFEILGGLSENDHVRLVDFISIARDSEREIANDSTKQ